MTYTIAPAALIVGRHVYFNKEVHLGSEPAESFCKLLCNHCLGTWLVGHLDLYFKYPGAIILTTRDREPKYIFDVQFFR